MSDIFFIFSKVIWAILSPSNLIVWLLLLVTLLVINNKLTAAIFILLPLTISSVVLMAYPIGDYLMRPLELRFPKPTPQALEKNDGIIVLGGGEQLKESLSWQSSELGAAADRYIAAIDVARRYPELPILFSGGSNLLQFQDQGAEGHIASHIFQMAGIDKKRVKIELYAKNTYENFVFLKHMLPNVDGRYILITSAYHMPRAVGIARQQGIDVVPYPVDFRSLKPNLRHWDFSLFEHLEVLEPAWREWLGLIVYYYSGKTSQLLPEPE